MKTFLYAPKNKVYSGGLIELEQTQLFRPLHMKPMYTPSKVGVWSVWFRRPNG
jgi:hypothetical protein